MKIAYKDKAQSCFSHINFIVALFAFQVLLIGCSSEIDYNDFYGDWTCKFGSDEQLSSLSASKTSVSTHGSVGDIIYSYQSALAKSFNVREDFYDLNTNNTNIIYRDGYLLIRSPYGEVQKEQEPKIRRFDIVELTKNSLIYEYIHDTVKKPIRYVCKRLNKG